MFRPRLAVLAVVRAFAGLAGALVLSLLFMPRGIVPTLGSGVERTAARRRAEVRS